MSGNPYKLGQPVDSDTQLWFEEITVRGLSGEIIDRIQFDYENADTVTLEELYEKHKEHGFLRVSCELGLWGVIFETGNYDKSGDWVVYGLTKGYA